MTTENKSARLVCPKNGWTHPSGGGLFFFVFLADKMLAYNINPDAHYFIFFRSRFELFL